MPAMARRYRLYLETSFWNRLAERSMLDVRRITYRFLNRGCRRHEKLISPLVVEEVGQTPDPEDRKVVERRMFAARPVVISGQARCRAIAVALRELGGFGQRMLADLSHVAYAVMGRADALVTWDRRTMARTGVRTALAAYCRREDIPAPLIGLPEEVAEWLDLKM